MFKLKNYKFFFSMIFTLILFFNIAYGSNINTKLLTDPNNPIYLKLITSCDEETFWEEVLYGGETVLQPKNFENNRTVRVYEFISGPIAINQDYTNSMLDIKTNSSSTIGQIIKGAPSQTADLLQLQDNNSILQSFFNSDGHLFVGTNDSSSGAGLHVKKAQNYKQLVVDGDNAVSSIRLITDRSFGRYFDIANNGAETIFSSDSTSTTMSVNLRAGFGVATAVAGYTSTFGQLTLAQQIARFQDINGNQRVLFRNNGQIEASLSLASAKGLILQGAPSQTGDLLQLQDNNSNVLAYFNANGSLVAPKLALGSNTLEGLCDGCGNISTLYVDVLEYKSPAFKCTSLEWCEVEFIEYDKKIRLNRDVNWSVNKIIYNDINYTKQEFYNLVQGTKYEEMALRLNKKLNYLNEKTLCNNKDGSFINSTCKKIIIVQTSVNYSQAVQQIPIYEENKFNVTCTKLNSDLITYQSICEEINYTNDIIDYQYSFKDNCGWKENSGYYCLSNQEIIIN